MKIEVTIIVILVLLVCIAVVFVRSLGGDHMGVWHGTHNLDFDKIDSYYINLDKAHKRKKSIEKQFEAQGLHVKRFSAVDGDAIDIEDERWSVGHMKDWLKENKKHIRHFACALSHIEVMKRAWIGGLPHCLIFEDDAEFLGSNFKETVDKNMKNVPDDWDILLFGYHIDDDNKMVKKGNKNLKIINGIINITYFTGLHAYLINRKALPILLKELPKHEWLIDWHMSYLAERGLIKIYGVFPPIMCQPAISKIKINKINLDLHCSSHLGGMLDGASH